MHLTCIQFVTVPEVVVRRIVEHIFSIQLHHLTAEALVLDGTDTETHLHAIVRHIEPTVREIELKHLRIIEEAVLVHVMGRIVARNMTEKDSAPLVAHLER